MEIPAYFHPGESEFTSNPARATTVASLESADRDTNS